MEVAISIAVAIIAATVTYALWRRWVASVFDLMKSASDWGDSLKEYSDSLGRLHALHIARKEALDRHEEELRKLAAPIERMGAE